jgi:enamine deaminase RidA (YjgF/YER057c/UK114 family)
MKTIVLLSALLAGTVHAQAIRTVAPGGEVVSAHADQHKFFYNEWHFAPARVDGNTIYLSGVVAGAWDGKPVDAAGYEEALRRAFRDIQKTLEAAGSDGGHIVEMTTYHVFNSPQVKIDKHAQIAAIRKVKDEFVKAPYPAWTGIGVADLFPQNGLVEIRITARKR